MKTHLIPFIFLLFCTLGQTQEKHINNLNSLPASLNPSFHGFKDNTRIGVISEFTNQNRGNQSQHRYAFASTGFENYNFQLGVDVFNNSLKNSGFNYTSAMLTYVYELSLSNYWRLYPALSAGFGNFRFDFSNLTFQDQLDIFSGQINSVSLDPTAIGQNESFFNVGASIMMHNDDNTVFGLSFKNINQPNISGDSAENEVNLQLLISGQVGHEIEINKYGQSRLPKHSFLYLFGSASMQGGNTRVDLYQDVTLGNIRLGINEHLNYRETANFNELGASGSILWETYELGLNYRFPFDTNSSLFVPKSLELFLVFDITRLGERGRRNYSRFY